uniref:Uncharacterized protein n=1 Tax=Populus alba TaxID=43335 RepID=A0A4U5MP15_POPAL|nr:hypothetical protein D5086_0000304460 [Populus alba]
MTIRSLGSSTEHRTPICKIDIKQPSILSLLLLGLTYQFFDDLRYSANEIMEAIVARELAVVDQHYAVDSIFSSFVTPLLDATSSPTSTAKALKSLPLLSKVFNSGACAPVSQATKDGWLLAAQV